MLDRPREEKFRASPPPVMPPKAPEQPQDRMAGPEERPSRPPPSSGGLPKVTISLRARSPRKPRAVGPAAPKTTASSSGIASRASTAEVTCFFQPHGLANHDQPRTEGRVSAEVPVEVGIVVVESVAVESIRPAATKTCHRGANCNPIPPIPSQIRGTDRCRTQGRKRCTGRLCPTKG